MSRRGGSLAEVTPDLVSDGAYLRNGGSCHLSVEALSSVQTNRRAWPRSPNGQALSCEGLVSCKGLVSETRIPPSGLDKQASTPSQIKQ